MDHRRPHDPDWVEAELHRRTAGEINSACAHDAPRGPLYWISAAIIAVAALCAVYELVADPRQTTTCQPRL